MSLPLQTSEAPRSALRRVAGASLAGNAIEYYDFSIYGLAAALVFPQLFFPDNDPFIATLATFGTLAVGYISRPLGAVVFGHFGDRIGRKPMLVITLLLMGVATLAIGMLPTFEQVGIWAAVMLTALRFLQGIAFGGEWGGAILMAFEYAPENRRGLFAAIPQVGPATGALLGNAVFLLVTLMPENQLMAWGWRLPFLFSFVLVIVGMFIRLKIAESPEFQATKDQGRDVKVPIASVLRNNMRAVLLVAGGFLGFGAFSVVVMTYLVGYSQKDMGIPASTMLTFTMLSFAIQIPMILFSGHLSDKYGRRGLIIIGSVAAIVAIFFMFWAVSTAQPLLVGVAYAVGFGWLYTICYGLQPALFADAFPAEVRFTGMSLGYQLANVVGSGFTPMIATWLLHSTGNLYAVPVFVAATLAISMICLVRLAVLAQARKSQEGLFDPRESVPVAAN
ncbi:MFS transporter [Arthrobacter crystallopoietes]|uniref:MFS transporter n=1 Tax=Crystallibacter crystallopoietes TaxID=37928 RepID=UPI003D1B7E2B